MKRPTIRITVLLVLVLGAALVRSSLAAATATADEGLSRPGSALWNAITEANHAGNTQKQYLNTVENQLQGSQQHLSSTERDIVVVTAREAATRAQLIPLLRYQYEYGTMESTVWLQLLLAAHDFQALQSTLADIGEIQVQRKRVIDGYRSALNDLRQLQQTQQSLVEDLSIARENIALEETLYAASRTSSVGSAPDSSMERVHEAISETWASEIAPQVRQILTSLDEMTRRLPDTLPKGAVTVGFPQSTVRVDQDFMNSLMQRYQNLSATKFLFRDAQLMVYSRAGAHALLMSGHWDVENGGVRAVYHVDNVAVDGILLSESDRTGWLRPYSFYIDVSQLSKHVHIDAVSVHNRELVISLSESLR